MSSAKTPLTVIYDSGNLANKIEVEKIKAKDKDNALTLADIASGASAEEHGCSTEAVKKGIHVRDAAGKVFDGIEALRVMHEAVGLGNYFRFCREPGLRSGPSGFFPKKVA